MASQYVITISASDLNRELIEHLGQSLEAVLSDQLKPILIDDPDIQVAWIDQLPSSQP